LNLWLLTLCWSHVKIMLKIKKMSFKLDTLLICVVQVWHKYQYSIHIEHGTRHWWGVSGLHRFSSWREMMRPSSTSQRIKVWRLSLVIYYTAWRKNFVCLGRSPYPSSESFLSLYLHTSNKTNPKNYAFLYERFPPKSSLFLARFESPEKQLEKKKKQVEILVVS